MYLYDVVHLIYILKCHINLERKFRYSYLKDSCEDIEYWFLLNFQPSLYIYKRNYHHIFQFHQHKLFPAKFGDSHSWNYWIYCNCWMVVSNINMVNDLSTFITLENIRMNNIYKCWQKFIECWTEAKFSDEVNISILITFEIGEY